MVVNGWLCQRHVRVTTGKANRHNKTILKGGSIAQGSSRDHSLVSKGLGPSARLRKRSDIERCQKHGQKLHAKHFLIIVHPSGSGESRLAIAVTTKLEKRAVMRNKIKRRIREVFRAARAGIVQPIDILVVARRDVQSCEFSEYEREILGALRAKGYFKVG